MWLSFNLHPILEGEHQPSIMVGSCFLHHGQPKGIVKLSNAILQLMQSEHEPADEVSFGLPLLFLLLEGIHPGLGLFIPCHIAVVAFGVLIANGTDVATIASLLGHSQPSTTLDIYTHAFDKNKKAASEALQRGLDI